MKQATATENKQTAGINRLAYGLFLILVIYQLITGNYEWAVSNFGIALVFDPFDPSIKWQDRPRFQKAWMITHLLLLIGGFALLVFG